MKQPIYRTVAVCTACLAVLAAACARQENPVPAGVPEGMVEVQPTLPGMLTASPTPGNRAVASPAETDPLAVSRPVATLAGTRMTEEELKEFQSRPEYEGLLAGKQTHPLSEGATLWLLVEGATDADPDTPYRTLKSYVVRGSGFTQALYPCTVRPDGTVQSEDAAPLYLPFGTYTFSALSPARAFLDEDGNELTDPTTEGKLPDLFRQRVENGDYLLANDDRYRQTARAEVKIEDSSDKVQRVDLPPLINQTAQLKFTIIMDPTDPYVHSCDISPSGVEISGLQDAYGSTGKTLWNWSPDLQDTLVAYPGKKDARLQIAGDAPGVSKPDRRLVVETAVLPTDGISSSIVVLFNLVVNGMPTQYQMMLNQKILRAGFSYHYRGTLTIEKGVAAIAWQTVVWETEVEIPTD